MSSQCKCSMAIKILGDGCEVCNPELAEEIRAENAQELDGEPVGEMVGHHRVGMGEMPTIKWRDGYWPTIGTRLYTESPKCARCSELGDKNAYQADRIIALNNQILELQAKLAAAENFIDECERLAKNVPSHNRDEYEKASETLTAIAEYKKWEKV